MTEKGLEEENLRGKERRGTTRTMAEKEIVWDSSGEERRAEWKRKGRKKESTLDSRGEKGRAEKKRAGKEINDKKSNLADS